MKYPGIINYNSNIGAPLLFDNRLSDTLSYPSLSGVSLYFDLVSDIEYTVWEIMQTMLSW